MERALIVGGGIGGLTLARGLNRIGVDIEVVEQSSQFSQVGAGITIQANAHAVLDALGIPLAKEDIVSIGKFEMINAKHRIVVQGNTESIEVEFPNVNIHRADLHRNLANATRDIPMTVGLAFQEMTILDNAIEVSFSDGTVKSYDYVIGADGVHSAVRKSLLGEPLCKTRYSGQTCWRFSMEADGNVPTVTTERWRPGQRIGAVPLSRGRVYIYMVASSEPNTAQPGSSNPDDLQKRFGNWHDEVDTFLFNLNENVIIHHGDLVEHEKIHYGHGRVLLIGDAAHAMTPNLGQGAGMAIEDAGFLTLLWAQGVNDFARALAHGREKRVRSIMSNAWKIGQMTHWENSLACFCRDLLLGSVPQSVGNHQTLTTLWKPGIALANDLRIALAKSSHHQTSHTSSAK